MRRLLAVVLLAMSGVSHAAIQTQEIPTPVPTAPN